MILLCYLLCLLRPSSPVYKMQPDRGLQIKIIAWFLAITAVLLVVLINSNPVFINPQWEHHRQYHKLAEALSEGHFYLDDKADPRLAEMENPYDYSERMLKVGLSGFLWDHAYFEGKYYVYFGVVPCLLFYLPYYLFTGAHMPTYIVVFITTFMTAAGIMLLLREIVKKWFPKTPFPVYMVVSAMTIFCGGLLLAIRRPDFYFVPITTALMLSVFGLYLWLRAEKDGGGLSAPRLLLGSLLMALVAGSRPQLVLLSFFSLVLFYKPVFKDRTLFSRKSLPQTLALVLPYAIVAAGLMYYNFKRFGSPFDFGANYNLTFNDMTRRGIRTERTFLGWFSYFLQPPYLTAVFPFLTPCRVDTAYLGITITEDMFGGILATNPFVWFSVLVLFAGKYFRDKKALIFSSLCLIFVLIITFADTQMAGILTRYFCDFSIVMHIGAAMTFMALYESAEEEKRRLLTALLSICFVVGVAYSWMMFFVPTGESLQACNPELYYKIKYLMAFWL